MFFLFAVTVIRAVVLTNKKPSGNTQGADISRETAEGGYRERGCCRAAGGRTDPYISGSTLTSDDLDFWHMYDETESPEEEEEEKEKKEKEKEKEQDPSTDGRHTGWWQEDGTEEWVSINPYLTKNTYDYSGTVYQYPIMKYYEDSEKSVPWASGYRQRTGTSILAG